MNREFIKKILQAKQLEYEAIKEILPSRARECVEELEENAIDILKEFAFDMVMQMSAEPTEKSKAGQRSKRPVQYAESDVSAPKRSSRVEVDFSKDSKIDVSVESQEFKKESEGKSANMDGKQKISRKSNHKEKDENKKTVKPVKVDFV